MDASEHRRLGVDSNNATWKVLASGGLPPEASPDERDDLLYGAYASAYHWRHADGATVANRARAEHLISRAATATGRFVAGLDHGMRCLGDVGRLSAASRNTHVPRLVSGRVGWLGIRDRSRRSAQYAKSAQHAIRNTQYTKTLPVPPSR